ncbi:MAG: HRDC domain-containing protein [Xanthomonadales bacterium]|nr:HRDC domain-containing protein [Xanthomonadales bacterium]
MNHPTSARPDWIASEGALAGFLEAAPTTIGLDTEFMRINTFAPRLALVQIGLGEAVGLVDPLGVEDPGPLAALLGDPARIIVMHSASEDLEALATWSCTIAHLFDTQIAASFAGLGAGLGYQKLVQALTGVELPKGQTRSDWMQRPLSAAQLDYAAQDVIHLPRLRAELAERVERRGFGAWLDEDCQRMLERARERGPEADPQVAFRAAAEWPRGSQARLRRVLLWRDATARRIDRPRPWLLDDAHALDLAARPPADATELAERSRGLRALRSAQRAELLDVLSIPLTADDLEFRPIPPLPSTRDKQAVAAMKQAVATVAAELDLPDALLASRRHLEKFVASRRWPSALEGWRHNLLHGRLATLLPG